MTATNESIRRRGNGPGRANASQLRDRIDRGLTGDKVAWPDPAAAPLGTDEEAAGHTISAEAAAMAHRNESRKVKSAPATRLGPAIWLYALFIVVLAIVLGWGASQGGSI
jgi:hypothetical protein